MNSLIKSLADGQLGNSQADMYLAPSSTPTVIKVINLHNTNAGSNRTIEIFFKPSGGTSRRLYKATIPPEGAAIIDDEFTMAAGDAIRGLSDIASEVNFEVSGFQFPVT